MSAVPWGGRVGSGGRVMGAAVGLPTARVTASLSLSTESQCALCGEPEGECASAPCSGPGSGSRVAFTVPAGDSLSEGTPDIGNLLCVAFHGKASKVTSAGSSARGTVMSHVRTKCLSYFGFRGFSWFSPGSKCQHWK